jgi:hypothetical protein
MSVLALVSVVVVPKWVVLEQKDIHCKTGHRVASMHVFHPLLWA